VGNHAPAGLSDAGSRFYRKLRSEHGPGADGVFLLLLEEASRCLDRLRCAEVVLTREGLTYQSKWGPRAHPATGRIDIETGRLQNLLSRLKTQIAVDKQARRQRKHERWP
jgi:hypothetical protein